MTEVRTRFAPSPTGKLHLGSAHTALYCWLYARRFKGKFVLRVEDTDLARSTKENVEIILKGMKWLGLDFDEGPIFQTDRFDTYRESVATCLENGTAYRCTCTADAIAKKREAAIKEKRTFVYDGTCRNKELGPDCGDHVVRFKMPRDGATTVDDIIKGTVSFPNSEMGDWIIMRTDGSPTYNFCVVIDDAQMNISHVIRGDDHLNNTFKQFHVYKALGYDLPKFAHMPLIHGSDGGKLSKRHGATGVMEYEKLGFLPIAVRNYLARLGWGHGDQEIFTDAEMTEFFDIADLKKSSSTFDMDKFLWVNAQHMWKLTPEELLPMVRPFMDALDIPPQTDAWAFKAIEIFLERAQTLLEIAQKCTVFFVNDFEYEEKPAKKFLRPVALEPLQTLRKMLEELEDFTTEPIQAVFDKLMADLEIKLGKIAQPVRVAITGGSNSPGIFEMLDLLGKEQSLVRLDRAIEFVQKRIADSQA